MKDNKILNEALVAVGLKVDPVRQAQEEAELLKKKQQAKQALALDRIARQTAYAGAALAAFTLFGVTVYFLRHTITVPVND